MSPRGDKGKKMGWALLEGLTLTTLLSKEKAAKLRAKGLTTVADVVRTTVQATQADQRPIEEFGLATHIVNRLRSKGYKTMGSTDTLSEEHIIMRIQGLGRGGISDLNKARASVGKPPLKKYDD